MFKYTHERKWETNLIIFFINIFLFVFLPSIVAVSLFKIINSETICSLIGSIVYILVLYIIYFKDINLEIKLLFKNFRECFNTMTKCYMLGVGIMIISNLIISFTIGEISGNETVVRETITKFPLYSFISVVVLAPLAEELLFRKSLRTVISNKWLFCILSGLLFGGAHLIGSYTGLIDLIYIIPYGGLGFSLALMYCETKSIFSSIFVHSFHNTLSFVLIMAATLWK